MSGIRIRAVDVIDELEGEGGAVVLVGAPGGDGAADHRLVRVSDLGRAVLELSRNEISFDRLVAGLVDRLGPPPGIDPEGAVREAVEALRAEGLVTAGD